MAKARGVTQFVMMVLDKLARQTIVAASMDVPNNVGRTYVQGQLSGNKRMGMLPDTRTTDVITVQAIMRGTSVEQAAYNAAFRQAQSKALE